MPTTTETKLIAANQEENRRALIRNMLGTMQQYNVIVDEIVGRELRVGDHWVSDFASCNYLGLDLHPDMDVDVQSAVDKWGVHPSWCRLVASPKIYDDLERALAELIGTEATLVLPTVTLISIGAIPALVGKSGVMILDKSGHETMYEACKIARDNGATLRSYRQGDMQALENILIEHQDNPRKLILIDGVYSMTGDYACLKDIQELAVRYGALVYVDDAHGFGVIGEDPSSENPYGRRGNGIVRHLGLSYENIIYVGGCSKAYSSLAAFVGCSNEMKTFLQGFATPYDLSGPCPTASLATLLRGLEITSVDGETIRRRLAELTHSVIDGLRALGFIVDNRSGFPIVSVKAQARDLTEYANLLFDLGILVTTCPYPMVAKGQEVLRITLTSANTEAQVARLLHAFAEIAKKLIQ